MAWIGRMLYENKGVEYFDNYEDVPFVKIDSVKLLYDVLNLQILGSLSLQDFFHLL